MSFFNKVLSKVGIGATKIDAVLDSTIVYPGQEVTGVLNIQGGKAAQEINKIDLDVYCNYFYEEEYVEEGEDDEEGETMTRIVEASCRINNIDINESFTIHEGESKQIPFRFILSEHAPLSMGKSKTWLNTNLDIDFAFDKSDRDHLKIEPNPLQAAVLDAIGRLGFNIVEIESERCSSPRTRLPFIQEFEFKAYSGDFYGRLDELELVMLVDGSELDLYLEIDRKSRGLSGLFAEAFGTDESKVHVSVNDSNLDDLDTILYNIISEHS